MNNEDFEKVIDGNLVLTLDEDIDVTQWRNVFRYLETGAKEIEQVVIVRDREFLPKIAAFYIAAKVSDEDAREIIANLVSAKKMIVVGNVALEGAPRQISGLEGLDIEDNISCWTLMASPVLFVWMRDAQHIF